MVVFSLMFYVKYGSFCPFGHERSVRYCRSLDFVLTAFELFCCQRHSHWVVHFVCIRMEVPSKHRRWVIWIKTSWLWTASRIASLSPLVYRVGPTLCPKETLLRNMPWLLSLCWWLSIIYSLGPTSVWQFGKHPF